MNDHSEEARSPSTDAKTDVESAAPDKSMQHDHTKSMAMLDVSLSPMNWPWLSKAYVSSASSFFTFALLFNATAITAGIPQIATEFGVGITHAIVVFSLFIFGIAFAPLYTPHVTERIGRVPTYFVGTLISSAFLIGSSRSSSITALLATRFFAGFFQAPVVVLIEGTYADVWPAAFTGSYYAFIAASQYAGAATGAVVGGTLVMAKDWRWTQYVGLMINLLALLYGAGMPETYSRQIIRQNAKHTGVKAMLEPAASGETLKQMASLTVVRPLAMLFTEPLVVGFALSLSLNFGVLFQFFILVPQVLNQLAMFDTQQAGFAFIAAYGGLVLAFVGGITVDQFFARRISKEDPTAIEHRMIPAIIGGVFMLVSLFWVGWTSRPGYGYVTPIVGTSFYVLGSMMHLSALVGYLFDAYSAPSTLAALTACAVTRVLSAGWFALFVLTAATNITGPWLLSVFGFISVALLPIPVVVLFYGKALRTKSRYADTMMSASHEKMQPHHQGEDVGHHMEVNESH